MADEILTIAPELKKLIDEVPVELLRKAPERYDGLKANKRGAWRLITEHLVPVAVAWTDWKGGFDIISIGTSDIRDRLENYVITAKALDFSAGWAYTTLDSFVKRFDQDFEVRLSEQSEGKLSGALRASGALNEENTEELNNGTEERV